MDMLASLTDIRDRLRRTIDDNGSVRDMDTATEAISLLEKAVITKEELEQTRLGLHVNNLRRASRNSPLAKRAKNLIKTWQHMIEAKGSPLRVQKTRPETPSSVGSSPSPPEPIHDFNSVRSYSSPNLPSRLPQTETQSIEAGIKKSKKNRTPADVGKSSKKRDFTDGLLTHKVQSSEVRSDKQSLDTGQNELSAGSNGLKMTVKTHPTVQASANQTSSSVTDGNSSESLSLRRSQTDTKLTVPQKSHKKKKGRKSPYTDSNSTQKQEELQISSANIKKSSSTPNFTVSKPSPPDKSSLKDASVAKIYNNVKSTSPIGTSGSLKRRRDSTNDSLDKSAEKPRGPKERKITYDPITQKIKKVPSQEKIEKPDSVIQNSKTTAELISKPVSQTNLQNSKQFSRMANKNFSNASKNLTVTNIGKNSVFLANNEHRGTDNNVKTTQKITPHVSSKDILPEFRKKMAINTRESSEEEENEEIPSRISPSVKILGSNSRNQFTNCEDACSSSVTNFHEVCRQFRKRKTRRKDPSAIAMTSLYPLSGIVEPFGSDSDENSEPESGFCSSIKHKYASPQKNGQPVAHFQNCRLPGVTGCRGSNGAWFSWAEMFCVRNHKDSQLLPDENEILPLQVLPYVELD